MAWAWGEILDEATLDALFEAYDGVVRRPSGGIEGLMLACPHAGSLGSLERRHGTRRFRFEGGRRVFVQPPRPSYRQLAYDSPPARYLFEFRSTTDSDVRVAMPLTRASSIVVAARDAALARLCAAVPGRIDAIDRHLVGRRRDGSSAAPAGSRIRIVPIPSIGMRHADRRIRRLLVEMPSACPLRGDDVRWAFSGATLPYPGDDERREVLLSPSSDDSMLGHYGVGGGALVFRTVTPAALTEKAARRRIEPARRATEAKAAMERVIETAGARAAVIQALRHAGVHTPVESVRLQREPFDGAGSRVEPFADGTRFEKERLWHVEITFLERVPGLLVIGDGRFLGLGVMAPCR